MFRSYYIPSEDVPSEDDDRRERSAGAVGTSYDRPRERTYGAGRGLGGLGAGSDWHRGPTHTQNGYAPPEGSISYLC